MQRKTSSPGFQMCVLVMQCDYNKKVHLFKAENPFIAARPNLNACTTLRHCSSEMRTMTGLSIT